MGVPLRSRMAGPLEPYSRGFRIDLRRQGYTANAAQLQLFLMAHVSRWLAGEGLGAAELAPAAVKE